MAQMVKSLPEMQETWVQSLGWEDSLKKGMATHASLLAWRIPWAEVHYSPWDDKELDMTECLTISLSYTLLHNVFISHARKVMLKIPQDRLQQYMNWELPDVQAGFRKGRGNRYQIANIHCIIEKARGFQKNVYICFIDYTK